MTRSPGSAFVYAPGDKSLVRAGAEWKGGEYRVRGRYAPFAFRLRVTPPGTGLKGDTMSSGGLLNPSGR